MLLVPNRNPYTMRYSKKSVIDGCNLLVKMDFGSEKLIREERLGN